jgi:hypothetical protein
MDEKISLEAISLYGDSYADKVLKGHFNGRDRITGPEILSLCKIQQVNLFVIKEIFRNWKEENKKLKSAFFDYDHPEVKEALDDLMNLLSQHISIPQGHFAPLFKKAVSQTLLVIFDPYDFFSLLITGKNNKLDIGSFREEIKYLKVNRAPLERMLQTLEGKNVQEISGNEAFAILDQILEEVNFTPEDVDGYIEKFSEVVPLNPTQFYLSKNTAPVTSLPPPPSVVAENKLKEETRINKAKSEREETNSPQALNDKHSRDAKNTLLNNFQRIKSIRESLTINQKFMFTKVLFHGDFELFSHAIERLDQLDTLPAALRYIEDEHASTWDRDSEEFHEFMELVEKRFV